MDNPGPSLEQLEVFSAVVDKLRLRRIIATVVVLFLAYIYGVLVVQFLGESVFPHLGYNRKLTWLICLAPFPTAWILWGIAVVECKELQAKDYSSLKASFHPCLLLKKFFIWAVLPILGLFFAALLLSLLIVGMLETFLLFAAYGAISYLVLRYGVLSIPVTYQFLVLSHWREWIRRQEFAAPEEPRLIRGFEVEEVLRITEENAYGTVYSPYQ